MLEELWEKAFYGGKRNNEAMYFDVIQNIPRLLETGVQ